MSRWMWSAAAAITAVISGPASGQFEDPVRFVDFVQEGGRVIPGGREKIQELDLEDKVDLRWRRLDFLRALAQELGIEPPGEPLKEEIERLTPFVEGLLESHEALLRANAVELRYRAAKATRDEGFWETKRTEAQNAFSDAATKVLEPLSTWPDLDPELERSLNEAVLGGPEAYRDMAQVLDRFLKSKISDLEDELAKRIQAGLAVVVVMEAYLQEPNGRQTPVHLAGYDEIPIGPPRPFERVQIAVDDRTREELLAAEKLGEVVKKFLDGSYEEELKRALEEIKKTLAELRTQLKTEALESNLDGLVQDLESARDETLAPFIDEVRSFRDWVKTLSATPELEGDTDAGKLISLSAVLDQNVKALGTAISSLPNRLAELAGKVQALIAERPGLVREDAVAALTATKAAIEENLEGMKEIYGELKALAETLGLTGSLSSSLESVQRLPREIAAATSLDTVLDPETIKERKVRPGDRIVITVRVLRKEASRDQEMTLASGRQRFSLHAYGWYLEPRGALMFVDPRSDIRRDLSYVPTVGLGLHWKVGIRGADWWNRILTPGIGVSFALLDFEDPDLELGVAASVTLIKDLFWLGYGRNLQVGADYAYVAINPMTLGGLLRN